MSWFERPRRRPSLSAPGPKPDAQPGFSAFLEAALEHGPGINPVAAALSEAQASFGAVDNMGATHDERDLFTQLDRLSAAVVQAFPQSLCFDGCGRCCRYPTAFFDIHQEEWDLLERHLTTAWEPERLEALLARFWREHGPNMPAVRFFESFLRWNLPVYPTRRALPLSCPFLENERCSVWEVRPLPCRTYGQFMAHLAVQRNPYVYACEEQREVLEAAVAASDPAVSLPDLGPFMRLQYRLTAGVPPFRYNRSRMRTIAGWLSERYRPEPLWLRWFRRFRGAPGT